jgi:hypothetical protein
LQRARDARTVCCSLSSHGQIVIRRL